MILDVAYNHSGEGNELGPTLSFKGIDNPTYYTLTGPASEPYRYYMNYTGCGNSLNLANTHVIRFVMDSLRYWVEVMHVDGFRFDLASVLGREDGSYQKSASFFDALSQDPVLGRVTLIAEPWDLGSYQVGNFPVDWSEWNGRFRDTVRRFVKGDAAQLRDLGWRLTGSANLYQDDGRSAYNSVNFITCHDGFTLNDLVSYNSKHNEANLEHNNDDSVPDISWFGADLGSPQWQDAEARTLCYRLDGGEVDSDQGAYHLFIILNSSPHLQRVAIPEQNNGRRWHRVVDTSLPASEDLLDVGKEVALDPADFYLTNPRTTVTLLGT